jgi:hypothetical protein
LRAYAITGTPDGILQYQEIATTGGMVPAGTPVLLECASPNAADCQLIPKNLPIFTAPDESVTNAYAPVADETTTNYTGTNLLKGTYYCNTDGVITYTKASGTGSFNADKNTKTTNPQTYVIGLDESGKLGFVQATGTYMPANKAWMTSAGVFPTVAAPSISLASGTYSSPQTVTITAQEGATILYSTDGGIDGIDTIPVREGRFVYEIPMRSPSTLVIVFPNYSELPVFARPGAEVDIKGDATHLREMAINGTDENGEMTKLRMELNRLMPPEVPGKVEEFIRENPESEVSVYLLQRYFLQEDAADYKRAMALVELMLKEQPDNGRLIEWKKQLPALCRGMVKAKLPAFTASDVKGRTVTQDELKKKANVLTVWASWSFQSTDMQRRLIRLKKDYGERLGVVSICLDARPQDCRQRVERDSLPWKTVCDGRVWQTPLLAKLGISEVPASMVIDSRGVIVARDLAPQELEDELKKMLE